MGRYVLRRRIEAPPERVFEAWTDPVVTADWMDADGIVDQTGPLAEAGTTFTLVIRGPWRFRMRVVRSERPRAHEMAGPAPLGASVAMTMTLTPRDGGTDLELVTAYVVPLGPLGRWMDRRWIDREPRAVANRELDRFVAIAHGAPPFAARADRPG